MQTKRFALVGICVSALLVSGLQQATAQVPPSAESGIITRSLERPDRPRSRLEDTIVVPDMDQAKAEGSTNKVFTLKGIVLDKSSVYQSEDFSKIYGPFVGQPVSFADLNAIAHGMTRKYREDGYIFSRVILPPQKIQDGVLHLEAVEGRIVNVSVTGNYKDHFGLIQKFADKIRSSNAANTKEIERYLLLIDDLPGITARSFMKPSATPGGGDLIISVEQDFFEGSVSIDNRGSRFVGRGRGELVGAFNSLFGIHDRTTLRALAAADTDELFFGEITHEEQIGSEGMRLKGRYAHTDTEPGGSLSPLFIEGDTDLFDLEALYPLFRGRQMNLNLLAGFNANNTDTDLAGVQIAKDRIRSARLGARVDFTDPLRGVNQIEAIVSQGLDVFNATSDGIGRSRANGEHEFFKINGTVTRIQDTWWQDLSVLLSGTGQYSDDPQLASEEFTVGGGFGRAYDAGEIAGDKGYAGLAEIRYGRPVDSKFLQSYQAYTFIDYGHISNLNPVVGEFSEDSLSSAGVGVRFNVIHDVSGYVEWNSPITAKMINAEGDDDSRFFFSILKRL